MNCLSIPSALDKQVCSKSVGGTGLNERLRSGSLAGVVKAPSQGAGLRAAVSNQGF